MKKLNIAAIRIDGGTQARVAIDTEAVSEYAEAVAAGVEFPPVVVFHDGADHWLADGFHRFHAHKQAGKASIPADVRSGTVRDAVLFSLGANCTHGLRRSNADKRKAVGAMLDDTEWSQWSDRKIAEACGVSHPFVAIMRKAREVVEAIPDAPAEVVTVTTPKPAKVESDSTSPLAENVEKVVTVTTQAPACDSVQVEDFGPSSEELAAQAREEEEERAALQKLIESDDKLATLDAENKRLRSMNRVLEERVRGLMNEKNEAIRAAKSWQRKFEKAERALKEQA